jgi:hypothetical protein
MTKTVKDDTKQCTLSFSGGVLSPSARTLNDNKQQRITHLFSQNRPDPVAQSGEGQREGGGKQRGKKSGGGAKEDAEVKEEELKQKVVPEAKEVAVKEEEVRKKEMPTDTKTDAVKEEAITGEKEDAVKEEEVREKEMPSDGKEDAVKEDEVKVQEVPSDAFAPCSGTEQLYCGVDENKIVPTLQIERKRKRLKQADSSEDEESGKSTSEIRGGDGEGKEVDDDDSAQSQKEEAVDPMDWRERIKVETLFYVCLPFCLSLGASQCLSTSKKGINKSLTKR